MPWKCFNISRTEFGVITLRRYVGSDKSSPCPNGYHNANIDLPEHVPFVESAELEGMDAKIPNDDPRWPVKCDHCDYVFAVTDEFQPNLHRVWQGVRDGIRIKGVIGNIGPQLPPGAMWAAAPDEPSFLDWLAGVGRGGRPGPDGKYMFVKLPGSSGVFCPDGPAHDQSGFRPCPWTRTAADPDTVVVSPSISLGGLYHGYVGQNGVPPGWVSDDTDGRKFDINGRSIR